MADLPDGMLPQALSAGGRAVEVAESADGPPNPAGGVGDSPVRGTLVPDVRRGPSAATLAMAGEGVHEVGELAHAGAVEPGLRPVVQPSNLTTEGRKRVDRADSRVRRRADHIVSTALRGPEFDPTGPKPDHISAKDWRIIRASWENMKCQPAWLTMAARAREAFQKVEAARESAPTLNVTVVEVKESSVTFPVLKVER